jgi:hypothetical protein
VIDRRQLGAPLDLAPEQLDQMAIVTPGDVLMAKATWLQYVPPRLVDLLDAAIWIGID